MEMLSVIRVRCRGCHCLLKMMRSRVGPKEAVKKRNEVLCKDELTIGFLDLKVQGSMICSGLTSMSLVLSTLSHLQSYQGSA